MTGKLRDGDQYNDQNLVTNHCDEYKKTRNLADGKPGERQFCKGCGAVSVLKEPDSDSHESLNLRHCFYLSRLRQEHPETRSQ